MIPDPLHPAIVHLPLAIAALLPLAVLWALLASRRAEGAPRAVWLPVVALASLFTVVAWIAEESGEDEEHRVEEVVGDDLVHAHEDAANYLKLGGWFAAVASFVGLAPRKAGRFGRVATLVLSVVVLVLAVRVGHSGGEIVHGPKGLAAKAGVLRTADD